MIATVLSLATSRLAGPVALAGCAVLAFMLVGAKMQVRELRRANSEYHRAIHDPVTGWAARLEVCKKSNANLVADLKTQNAAVESMAARARAKAAELEKAASGLRSDRERVERQARELAAVRSAPTCEGREAAAVAMAGEIEE